MQRAKAARRPPPAANRSSEPNWRLSLWHTLWFRFLFYYYCFLYSLAGQRVTKFWQFRDKYVAYPLRMCGCMGYVQSVSRNKSWACGVQYLV